ncbi:hypothetical protein ANN_03649, partial [Periplaneta americana]
CNHHHHHHHHHSSSEEKKLKNTFGWARIDVLVMLIGCVFLASLCFSLVVEALQTLVHIEHHDEMHHPIPVMCVGACGLLLNGLCYLLIGGYTFHQGSFLHVTPSGGVVLDGTVTKDSVQKGERHLSAETRPASLPQIPQRQGIREMCRDIIGCIFVIGCSLIVYFTDQQVAKYVDPALSIVSAILLFVLSYPYMKESGSILLQTIPDTINIDSLRSELLKAFPDIINVHDLHVWRLTATKVFSTAHIIFLNSKVRIHRMSNVSYPFLPLQAMSMKMFSKITETNLNTATEDFWGRKCSEIVFIVFRWIPSHCGILGNENADALAKKGSTATFRPVTKSTYYSVKRFIKSTYLDFNKQNLIAQSQGKKWNSLHHNPQLIPDLPRKSSVATFRLATGHDCLAKHLHRIGIYQSPNCPLCNSNQEMDSEHLKICASVADHDNIFEKYWSARGQMTLFCASHTLSFLATTDFLNAMKKSPTASRIHHPTLPKCLAYWNASRRHKYSEIISDDYVRITKDVTEFFHDQGITQVTIQPEFFKMDNRSSLMELPSIHANHCLVQCRELGCHSRHCCSHNDQELVKVTIGGNSHNHHSHNHSHQHSKDHKKHHVATRVKELVTQRRFTSHGDPTSACRINTSFETTSNEDDTEVDKREEKSEDANASQSNVGQEVVEIDNQKNEGQGIKTNYVQEYSDAKSKTVTDCEHKNVNKNVDKMNESSEAESEEEVSDNEENLATKTKLPINDSNTPSSIQCHTISSLPESHDGLSPLHKEPLSDYIVKMEPSVSEKSESEIPKPVLQEPVSTDLDISELNVPSATTENVVISEMNKLKNIKEGSVV